MLIRAIKQLKVSEIAAEKLELFFLQTSHFLENDILAKKKVLTFRNSIEYFYNIQKKIFLE